MIWATLSRAVLLLDVVDDLLPPVLAEVDVEVRHRHAVGVEEALEQEVVAQRIEVGDGQRVGDERAGARAAARADRDVARLGPLDEVGDDQEVARVLHLDDDAELELEARVVVLPGEARRRARTARAGARAPRAPPARSASASAARPSSSLWPGWAAKRGRIGPRVFGRWLARWAISTVLFSASGRSAKSSSISLRDLK